jgi:phage terminase large subunit-like protein
MSPLELQAAIKMRLDWLNIARGKQLPPIQKYKKWNIWLVQSGRGFGKTRLASEDCWWYAATNSNVRVGIICATSSDTRKTAFEGESGLISRIPPQIIQRYNKMMLEIELKNGSLIQGFSADEPGRLRGPQFHRIWCDELATWRCPESWDMLQFCLRLGDAPKIIITTTPQPTTIIKSLHKRDDVHITRGSTFENAANLAPTALEQLKKLYEGTRVGRQELYAELLDEIDGALWTHKMIDETRFKVSEDIFKIVVAIDPAITKKENSDETGIIVCGKTKNKYVVLDDLSGHYTPDEWASKAVWAFDKYLCDAIVAEVNQGGDMVESIIRNKRRDIHIRKVHATKGKYVRAEPIAALYEQAKVIHNSCFEKLEEQMTTYTPTSKDSPDRLDALVWGLTHLTGNNPFNVFIV